VYVCVCMNKVGGFRISFNNVNELLIYNYSASETVLVQILLLYAFGIEMANTCQGPSVLSVRNVIKCV